MSRTLTAIGLLATVLVPARAVDPPDRPPPAQTQLDVAFSMARADRKPVFVIFGWAGCGPCQAFDAYHADAEVRQVLDRHLVLAKVDSARAAGAEAVMK